ncbi:MAG: adenylyl-sulfate reductase [Pseudomonadota bacterium]
MFTTNPFLALTEFMSPAIMQGYVVLMILVVAFGTLFDLLDGQKARFFMRERERSRAAAKRRLGGAEVAAISLRTLVRDIATFGEFSNPQRRYSHILMFYGFVLYLITTVTMIFGYPAEAETPTVLPVLWYVGCLMTLLGGYWFFFCLRVNVTHDGHSLWRLERADIFIVLLLASVTSALLFGLVQSVFNGAATKLFASLYILFTTLLFISVPWSKFAHMFYKPVVAFQKRLDEANGSSDLPRPADARQERT